MPVWVWVLIGMVLLAVVVGLVELTILFVTRRRKQRAEDKLASIQKSTAYNKKITLYDSVPDIPGLVETAGAGVSVVSDSGPDRLGEIEIQSVEIDAERDGVLPVEIIVDGVHVSEGTKDEPQQSANNYGNDDDIVKFKADDSFSEGHVKHGLSTDENQGNCLPSNGLVVLGKTIDIISEESFTTVKEEDSLSLNGKYHEREVSKNDNNNESVDKPIFVIEEEDTSEISHETNDIVPTARTPEDSNKEGDQNALMEQEHNEC